MGLSLYIKGIRKLNSEERKALGGREIDAIWECACFRQFFPSAPENSGYWVTDEYGMKSGCLENLRNMFTPVEDADGETLLVCWQEPLGYVEYKSQPNKERIDCFLEETRPFRNPDDEYHPVSYGYVASLLDRDPSEMNEEEEIIVYTYG